MTKACNHKIKPYQLTISLFVGILCMFLSSCNYFESEQSKLQKAKKLFEENKFNESIFLAKNILQSNPKNCEARILLGQDQFAKFSLIDAQDSFKKAKEQGCKDGRIFTLWVRALLYMNKIDEAKALFADPYFNASINEPENILLEGDLYFYQKNYEKANEIYAEYYNKTHDKAVNCLLQTKLLAMQNKLQDVVKNSTDCESSFASDRNFPVNESRYLRAIAQVNLKEEPAAVATLNTILEKYSNSSDPNIKIQSSLLLMKLYIAQRDIENAAKMADALLKYIALPDIYHAKGLKAEHDNKLDIAEQQFLLALKLNPRYVPSLLELANIKYKEGNVEQAKYYTGKVDALTGKSTFTDRLDEVMAIKYLQAGDLDAIINTLPNDKNSGSAKSKYILALAYAQKGDQENAWKAFHAVENKIPDAEKRALLKARLYIALGDYNNAEQIYKKYLNNANTEAVLGLSQLYIQEKKYDAAERLLTDSLPKTNDKYRTTLLLVELYSATNQKQKTINLLDQAIKGTSKNQVYKLVLAKVYYKYAMYQDAINLCDTLIDSGNTDSYIVKASSLIRLGKNNEAKQVFNLLLQKDQNNSYAYTMLSYLAAKESDIDTALMYIDKSLAINPKNINAIYSKIELLVEKRQNNEALEFAKSSANLINDKQKANLLLGFAYSKIGDSKNAYLNYLGALENGNQDVRVALKTYMLSVEINGKGKAINEFDRWLNQNQNLQNLNTIGNFFMGRQEYDLAEKYYEIYITKDQRNPAIYNNLAWLKSEQGKNKEALDYADKALALAPNSPAIMDTMGLVLLRTGDYDKAGSYILSAYQKLNTNPSVKYHLALFYFYKNNLNKSRDLLQEIGSVKFPEQADAQKLLAEINKQN